MTDHVDRLREALKGHYTIEREVGEGGMAVVYLAHDVKHDRRVAIKVLKPEIAAALGLSRFLREIRIAARLQHPHILPLYDSGEGNGVVFYVMPYVEGESLKARLEREKQLPVEDALRITREIAEALGHAHSHGVVHRDVKPANILLIGGNAVVADFGVARALSAASSEELTSAGVAVGTPAYMSPEQASGSGEVDGRSDVYGLGCVLYEMLAGEPPFAGTNAQSVMAKHATAPVPSVRVVRNSVPEFVDAVATKALAKTAADRFATAQQFSDALTVGGSMPGVSQPDLAAERRPAARWRGVAFALVAVLVVLSVILAASMVNRGPPEASELDPYRVAVPYFDDRSEGGELRYLAESFTEDLIDALSRVPVLKVIPRTGVARYRSSDAAPAEIAQTLAAGTLVDGTVETFADRIRVTVRLIDTDPLEQRRTTTVTTRMGDVFALRDAVTDSVSRFLREALGEEFRLEAQLAGTDNERAWELLQRAERERKIYAELRANGDTSGARAALERGEVLLTEAQSHDRDWVDPIVLRGWLALDGVELAAAQVVSSRTAGTASVFGGLEQAITHAGRALALESADPEALELRGIARYRLWDPPVPGGVPRQSELLAAAEEDLRAARATHPWPARVLSTLSDLVRRRGNFEEARVLAEEAVQRDEFLGEVSEVTFQLGQALMEVARVGDALEVCEQAMLRFTDETRFATCALTALAASLDDLPEVERAWQLADAMVRRGRPDTRQLYGTMGRYLVATVLARAGAEDSARAVMEDALAKRPSADPRAVMLHYNEAIAWLNLGEPIRALGALDAYLTAVPQRRTYLANDWWFDELRDHPRFRDLVQGSR